MTSLEIVWDRPEQVAAYNDQPGATPVRDALLAAGLALTAPLPPALAGLPRTAVMPEWLAEGALPEGTRVYLPDGRSRLAGQPDPGTGSTAPAERPEVISEADAVQLAYHANIEEASSFLRAGLSVVIHCEKIVVPHLDKHIVLLSGYESAVLSVPEPPEERTRPPLDMMGGPQGGQTSLRQRLLTELRTLLQETSNDHVVVIPHLDLLGGGSDSTLANETRDLVDLLYSAEERVLLAFSDPSLTLPEVLANRFAVRMSVEGSPRAVWHPKTARFQPIERVLVTAEEATRFSGLDKADFYKYVAGLNPVRLRQAIRYSYLETTGRDQITVKDLQQNIRKFKVQASSNFEIPTVSFDDIGGYTDVKAEIQRALNVMMQARALPEEDQGLRGELIPRGFIFHGEPGTGKTLFAKAIANSMDATVQVVSGPEVTDKYVGESERKIREVFSNARRNAPAVIVFDEFDSIAANRSTAEDGGSRAGNAMVAQILTEMDGFRPDVQMLVIGTTNRLELIDRALLRPSRFQSFHIGLPDPEARLGIIRVHSRRFKVDVDGLEEPLVTATDGWNGDEIRALFRDAFVGKWLEGTEVDAERLGELVGHTKRMRKQQQHSKAGR
jgi:transitional endoplasmic reticulum ATPase